MPLSPAALQIQGNALRSAIGGLQAHTANPGTGGAASKSSAAMVVPAWDVVDSNGNFDLAAPAAFSGCTPNGPITYVSTWTNALGTGTWLGNYLLSGDLTADASGNYNLTSLDLTGGTT